MTPEELVQKALESFQSGDIKGAERMCTEIVEKHADNFDALLLLGIIYSHLGRYDLASKYIEQAVGIDETNAAGYFHLGNVFKERELADEAINCYKKAIELYPEFVEAYNNLGNLFQEERRTDDAMANYQKAIELDPDFADPYYNMANILRDNGRFDEAITHYRKAIELDPDFADAYYNLGFVFSQKKFHDEAIQCYQKVLDFNPESAEAYNRLGNAYQEQGKFDEAIKSYRQALQRDPRFSVASYNMGNTLWAQGNREESINAYNDAIQSDPDFVKARWAKCMAQLLIIYPDDPAVQISRERYRRELTQLHDYIPLETPEDLENAAEAVGSTQPFFLACQGLDDRDLQRLYGELVCKIMALKYPQFSQRPAMPSHADGEPIRIGIVSRFFYWHSVWKIPLRGILENIDKGRFSLNGYSTGSIKDETTEKARRHLNRLEEDVYSFEKMCRVIRDDNLHVLLYPEIGMDPMTLRLASLRLAPVQCATLGHPDTSGLPTIDYFLSSDLMEPDKADDHYTEKLVRLPNLSFSYTPFDESGQGISREEFKLRPYAILYLCSHSLFTHLPRYDQIYPRIAAGVNDCQFLFIADTSASITEQFHSRLKEAFKRYDMDPDKHIVFLPRLDQAKYHAVNVLADVSLDTPAWSANNSTFEAIDCNLPVVTLPGQLMRQRHCFGILTMMGLKETIATTVDEYVEIAVRLGKDKQWRRSIAEKISANKHRVYGDKSCISAVEEFFEGVVRKGL